MRKLTAFFVVLAMCALLLPQASQALPPIGISPRIAVPMGDFSDAAGLGLGLALAYEREVSGYPALVTIGLLKFGEKEIGPVKSNTRTIFVNVGSRYPFMEAAGGTVYAKLDISRNFVHTEAKTGGFSASANSGANKLFPGVGFQKGPMGAQIEYDLGGEWLGINCVYLLGSTE